MLLLFMLPTRADNNMNATGSHSDYLTTVFQTDIVVTIDTTVTLQCGQTVRVTGVLHVNDNGQVTGGELHIEEVGSNESGNQAAFHYVGDNNSWSLTNDNQTEESLDFLTELEELLQNIINNTY